MRGRGSHRVLNCFFQTRQQLWLHNLLDNLKSNVRVTFSRIHPHTFSQQRKKRLVTIPFICHMIESLIFNQVLFAQKNSCKLITLYLYNFYLFDLKVVFLNERKKLPQKFFGVTFRWHSYEKNPFFFFRRIMFQKKNYKYDTKAVSTFQFIFWTRSLHDVAAAAAASHLNIEIVSHNQKVNM